MCTEEAAAPRELSEANASTYCTDADEMSSELSIEAVIEEQARQLADLQQLQERLTKQHTEQQQTMAITGSGDRVCFNDDGNCTTPACFAEA